MIGRNKVGKRNWVIEIIEKNERKEIEKDWGRSLSERKGVKMKLERLLKRVGKGIVIGNKDGLRGSIVIGMWKKIGGDKVRVIVIVGKDKKLGWKGDNVDEES